MPALTPRPQALGKIEPASPNPSAVVSPSLWPDKSEEVWQQVQQLASKIAPLVWVSHLQLVKADTHTAWLGPKPGRRDVMKFVTVQKNAREPLATFFQQLLGQTVQVEWHTAPSHSPSSSPTTVTPVPATSGSSASRSSPNSPDHDHAANFPITDTQTASSSMGERQAAMRLPLVRQVMDLFDATIVQVKAENVPDSQESQACEAADPVHEPGKPGSPLPGHGITHGFSSHEVIEDSSFQDEDDDV